MKQYQQRLIILLLVAILVLAEFRLTYFEGYQLAEDQSDQSTIYTSGARLWANVTDCKELNPRCTCIVTSPELPYLERSLQFLNETNEAGYIDISGLTRNSSYSFYLTCKTTRKRFTILTVVFIDYGRPLEAENIRADIVDNHIQITWEPPRIPVAAFSFYQLCIDDTEPIQIHKNETSYRITEEYQCGTRFSFSLVTCYINQYNITLCSSEDKSRREFIQPQPMSTTVQTEQTEMSSTELPTTASTSKSNGVCCCLVQTFVLLLCYFVIIR